MGGIKQDVFPGADRLFGSEEQCRGHSGNCGNRSGAQGRLGEQLDSEDSDSLVDAHNGLHLVFHAVLRFCFHPF